jgi:hypothetical protein
VQLWRGKQNKFLNNVILKIIYNFNVFAALKTIFVDESKCFCRKISFNGIGDCDAFSVAPSIINENVKTRCSIIWDERNGLTRKYWVCRTKRDHLRIIMKTNTLAYSSGVSERKNCCSTPGVNVIKLFSFVADEKAK